MRTVLALLVFLTNAGLVTAHADSDVARDNTRQFVDRSSGGPTGTWAPHPMENHSTRSVMIVASDGRFAMLVAPRESGETESVASNALNAASGSWELADDGGELVLTLDSHLRQEIPGTTRYLKMLLLGDELRPYPGMEKRFPIAATSWLRTNSERSQHFKTD